jgi:hypothetical protein
LILVRLPDPGILFRRYTEAVFLVGGKTNVVASLPEPHNNWSEHSLSLKSVALQIDFLFSLDITDICQVAPWAFYLSDIVHGFRNLFLARFISPKSIT